MDSRRIITHPELRLFFQLWKVHNLLKKQLFTIYKNSVPTIHILWNPEVPSTKYHDNFWCTRVTALKIVCLSKLQSAAVLNQYCTGIGAWNTKELALIIASCPSKWVELLTFSPLQCLLVTEWPPVFFSLRYPSFFINLSHWLTRRENLHSFM